MAATFKDYYKTLGVARTATPEEIKSAFRKLARLHHPDVAKDKVGAEAKFKEINEANEVLSDPEKRRQYDDLGVDGVNARRAQNGAGGFGGGRSAPGADSGDFEFGGTGFSDFFESYFGGRRSGFGAGRQPGGRGGFSGDEGGGFTYPGEDIEADLLVTLEEALSGAVRKISLRRPATETGEGQTNSYQVRIPAGVREGQRIRLAGQGYPGHGGAAAGDLYLRVRLAQHPDFSVRGADLYYDYDLAPWEAVLGTQLQVNVLGGSVTLKVPAGTVAGGVLRLRGLGLPREDKTRGDLYATARVQTPASVSAEERTAWEQIARVSTFNPRSST